MSLVTYALEDHVATITLNRPDARNAINGELRRDLNAAWDRFRDDEEAWVGVLTANGSVFCAGGDLKDGEGAVGTFGGTFWEKPTINSFEKWDGKYDVAAGLSVMVHTAYHLGGIRQALGAIRAETSA